MLIVLGLSEGPTDGSTDKELFGLLEGITLGPADDVNVGTIEETTESYKTVDFTEYKT